ncbi:MAG TPA: flagellar biosynthesis protein FlhA [Candidatus Acidoferrales bacterium]|nr:flagellar biosynthesis protein FlhA [Candidatus Acidoferrales bacterium]
MASGTLPVRTRILEVGIGTPLVVTLMLAMVVLPLPAPLLDLLFTFNIAMSLVVLLATVYVLRPLDLGIFPSVLLITTLLRLAMNVASTRVILLHGHEGGDAAGKVIEAFGHFVIGGNYAVGLVVFAILVIVNFVVVTKGAGRISEVAARFTLDALPGKQMAIDADVGAGLISQEQARQMRQEVRQEADFYGAMDGAGKFVRGDAVAGVLVLFINLIGGMFIGMLQHGQSFMEAVQNYTLLTIGDGLVAQIPALLLSVATAVILTRVAGTVDMGGQMVAQLLGQPRSLVVAGGILMALGAVPGMPSLVFLALGGVGLWVGYRLSQRTTLHDSLPPAEGAKTPAESAPRELSWDELGPIDLLELEVGYRLIPLLDPHQGGEVMDRIKSVRKALSQEMGFLIPPMHIRDNLELAPTAYRLSIKGVVVGQGELQPERDMAIDPGQVFGSVEGLPTLEPAFGLDALWIEKSQREQAQTLGYTVVDTGTVLATHLSQLLRQYAHELLGHDEIHQLLSQLGRVAPKLVEELVPKAVSMAVLVQVLRGLLEDGVSIRDMRTIAEVLVSHAGASQDPAELLRIVRERLGRSILQQLRFTGDELPVIALDHGLEQLLSSALQEGMGIEPALAERLLKSLGEATQRQEGRGEPAVLLVSPRLRPVLARMTRHAVRGLHVLAFGEIPDDRRIRLTTTIGA